MNVLIVDDEQLARQRLRHLISSIGEHTVVSSFTGIAGSTKIGKIV